MRSRSLVSSTPARRTLAVGLSTIAACVALVACGGGGSASVQTPAAVTVSGVVASGAAFEGATVSVIDSRGETVGSTSAPVDATGRFSIELAAGATAPFVIVATRTSSDGAVDTLVSVLDKAHSATVNVTPVTTLVAARLSPSGNPLALAAELKADPATIDAAKVAATLAEIKEILAPVLAATDTAAFDPLNGEFAADGTGHDRLLDAITVTIIPASASASNIEVGIKQATAEGVQPPVIQFASTATLAEIKTQNDAVIAAPIDSGDLVASGTNVLIQQLLARLTACYALPVETRVGVGGVAASDVVATECKTLFADNDPAKFLSNGAVVGSNRDKDAFSGMFRAGATGVVFTEGSYEFTRANGDLVIGYRWTDSTGAQANESVVVTRQGDELKLIGNQYVYAGGVVAYQQRRQFVTLDQAAYNYHSTGYVLKVPNNGLFDRVEVVSPSGGVLRLNPAPASRFMVLQGTANTNFVRLGAAFDDAATAALGSPADVLSSEGNFFTNPQRTDAEIAAIPAQAVWTFKYYLKTDPSTLAATQHFKTRARALALAEFRTQPMAVLTNALLADIKSGANANGVIDISGQQVEDIEWIVPQGAIAPTSMTAFGKDRTDPQKPQSFNDSVSFASTKRIATVPCSQASLSDTHCVGTSGIYAPSTYLTGLHLWSRDSGGREYANFYATYKVTLKP